MEGVNFFSRRYKAPEKHGERLRGVEKYMTRQNMELYPLLHRMEKQLAQLEARISRLEGTETETTQSM